MTLFYEKMAHRTSQGLSLMILGMILSWIQYVQYLAVFLELAGAIFIIIGKNGFGTYHIGNVTWAIIIFIVYVLGVFFVAYGLSLAQRNFSAGLLLNYMLISIFVGALGSIATILLVLGLSDLFGKVLLVVGLVASLSLSISIYTYLVVPRQSIAQLDLYRALDLVPLGMFALAYYRARDRVVNDRV